MSISVHCVRSRCKRCARKSLSGKFNVRRQPAHRQVRPKKVAANQSHQKLFTPISCRIYLKLSSPHHASASSPSFVISLPIVVVAAPAVAEPVVVAHLKQKNQIPTNLRIHAVPPSRIHQHHKILPLWTTRSIRRRIIPVECVHCWGCYSRFCDVRFAGGVVST